MFYQTAKYGEAVKNAKKNFTQFDCIFNKDDKARNFQLILSPSWQSDFSIRQ